MSRPCTVPTAVKFLSLKLLLAAVLSGSLGAPVDLHARTAEPAAEAALEAVRSYLQAVHARDARAAYRLVSSADRSVHDEKTYFRSQENFAGFALELSRLIAADMEVWLIEQKLGGRDAWIEVGYRVPTGDEISPQLPGWNSGRLNALSPAAQNSVIDTWQKVKKGRPIVLEGRESFHLVREKDGWKIFLDWRSRHRVVFKTAKSQPAELAVEFVRNDFLVKNDEPFQVDFRLTNRSNREITVKLDHLFEPQRLGKNVDMIACGSILPVRLRPKETLELFSAYLLRGDLGAKTELAIVYDFRRQPPDAPRGK